MKWLWIMVAVLAIAYYFILNSKDELSLSEVTTVSSFGFVALPENNISMDKIIILTPPNCPSAQAQRANAIADYLDRENISYIRASSVNFHINNENEIKLINSVMAGEEQPVVIVKGRAKGNPDFSGIVGEYRSR